MDVCWHLIIILNTLCCWHYTKKTTLLKTQRCNLTLCTVKTVLLKCHNDISAELVWPLLLTLVSSWFSGWITEQQLPITSTQTESHRVVSAPQGSFFLKSHENGSLQKQHDSAPWTMTRPSLRRSESILPGSDQSHRWWSECAGSHSSTTWNHRAGLVSWLGAALPDLRSKWGQFTAGWRLSE